MKLTPIERSDKVECFCIIKNLDKKTTVKGDTYLDMTIGDKEGDMNAKVWGYTPEEYGVYTAGDIVKIRGNVVDFKGAKQLRVDRIRHTLESDNIEASDLVRSAAFEPSDMYNELIRIAEGFSDNDIKNIVIAIYTDYKEKLLFWPAAYKLHHAIRGGLLMHTLSIVRLCESVCAIYPFLDRELLIGGAMLHDIAKIKEYDVNSAGTAEKYSIAGNLLGHISMGAEIVGEYAKKTGADERCEILLKHMILSHHGQPEFGAAVRPMIMEAEILSELDLMDARLYEMKEALSSAEKGEFTSPVWALENVKLFNHGRKDSDIDPKLI